MLTRARNARSLARSATVAFTPPVQGRCCNCSTGAANKGGQASGSTVQVSRPRPAAVQPIDWSQPSTSAIPYSPSPSTSSSTQTRSYSTSSRPLLSPSQEETSIRLRPSRRQRRRAAAAALELAAAEADDHDYPPPLPQSTIPKPKPQNPFTLLDSVLAYKRESDRNRALPALLLAFEQLANSPSPSPSHAISRSEWRSLFARVSTLYPPPDETPVNSPYVDHTRRFVSSILKRLRQYALHPSRQWDLQLSELRTIFRVRLDKEEREQRARVGEFGPFGAGKGLRTTKERWEYLDELGRELGEEAKREVRRAEDFRGGRKGPTATISQRFDDAREEEGVDLDLEEWRRRRVEWEDVAHLLERFSLTLSNRLSRHPPSLSHPLSNTDLSLALRASSALRTAHSITHFLRRSALDVSSSSDLDLDLDPHPDLAASLPLPFLFASPERKHRRAAWEHLSSCVGEGKLLTAGAIRQVVGGWYGDPPPSSTGTDGAKEVQDQEKRQEDEDEASYLRARAILSSVCSDPCPSRRRLAEGNSRLDDLLRLRLERVERREKLEREPTLGFVEWVGREMSGEVERERGGMGEGEEKGKEGEGRTRSLGERQQALEVALRYWEASQVLGKNEWDVGALRLPRSPVAKLLEELVRRACELEKEAAAASAGIAAGVLPPSSACLETAVRLAIAYLPPPLLTHLSVSLLHSVTTSSHSPQTALALFETLTAPSPPPHTPSSSALLSAPPRRPYALFTWTTSLLPSFTSLFLSAASPSSSRADAGLAMRLYLSWTSAGLLFPAGLWTALWRAAGRRGNVDEVERLVRDWEETGRGQVTGRIIRFVVEAAAEAPLSRRPDPAAPPHPADPSSISSAARSRSAAEATKTPDHVLPALRLLHFFRSRYAPSPTSPPPPHLLHHPSSSSSSNAHLLVPLPAYVSTLRLLSRSHSDRRSSFRLVWQQLLLDGHSPNVECFNAAIAINVWRPEPGFGTKDVDAAGVVYNAHVAAAGGRKRGTEGLRPNRETFSLLLHGFMRIAERSRERRTTQRRRTVVLEAGLRTFEAAHMPSLSSPAGVGVRGHQTAKLVRLLAREGRFEDAKRVQEGWWRSFVALEAEVAQRREREKGMGEKKVWEKRARELEAEGREMEIVRGEVGGLEERALAGKKWAERERKEGRNERRVGGEEEDDSSEEAFETVDLTFPSSSSSQT